MKKKDYTIIPFSNKYISSFRALVTEYLPGSEPDTIFDKFTSANGTILLAVHEESVLGCVFGWPTKRAGEYLLDGIAVTFEQWRTGIGSALLKAYEQAVVQKGYRHISLGSAGGFVEDFYLRNGYQPTCYKIYQQDSIITVREFDDLDYYTGYSRPSDEGFVVMEKRLP